MCVCAREECVCCVNQCWAALQCTVLSVTTPQLSLRVRVRVNSFSHTHTHTHTPQGSTVNVL